MRFTSPGGGDKTFVHTQLGPASTWTVAHNLGKRPAVEVTDTAGSVVEADVRHLSDNAVEITFGAPFAGAALLN